jgi:hyaluronan synthase
VAALAATVALIVGFHAAHPQALQPNLAVGFYLLCAGVLVWFLLSFRREPWRRLEPASGRVVAVVPAYNEDPAVLRACLDALLSGSVVPDVVQVMDDGSDPALEPYEHGLVVWHRQTNQGKRWAQVNSLRDETDADFIVTLDSDSVPHRDALRECLRALSDPGVQGATAVVGVRNRRRNWLTRLVDLELVYGCLVQRAARSSLGAVAPTSGAFAVYRAAVLRDNMVDYVLSGTAGDDRRLTEYALLRGRVVGCSQAWVEAEMPETLALTFRQRVRWFKSYFLYLRWELSHLAGWPFRLRVWSLAMTLLFPILLAWALLVVPVAAGSLYWQPFLYWVGLLYAQTARYAAARPGMSPGARLASWLLLTPLLIPWSLFLVKPALYRAIPHARNLSWQTR